MARSSKREVLNAAPQQPQGRVVRGGNTLPGIAGYHGVGRLPKNAMPISRFVYVRPDGKG